jgi:L-iditol 2-dehydrogenase
MLPKTMKVAVYYKSDDIRVEEQPIPIIGPGEILVKTKACGLCGGETMDWYIEPRAPKVLGHEPTGVVIQTGPGVTNVNEGDRVFVHHHVACMSCHYCYRGAFTLCDHYRQTGIDPGGFAEYFRVPAEIVQLDTLVLPDNVSFEEGTIIEPMACALKGIRQTCIHPGDTLAIVGVGFMGLCYLQLALLQPIGRTIALDLNEWRLGKAKSLGATNTINTKSGNVVEEFKKLNEDRGADIVIVTAPSVEAWELGQALCDKGATLHLGAPAPPDEVWCVQPTDLWFQEIKIHSTYSATHMDTEAVLNLLASGRVDANSMITHRFNLDDVAEGIRLLRAARESLKILLIPDLGQS